MKYMTPLALTLVAASGFAYANEKSYLVNDYDNGTSYYVNNKTTEPSVPNKPKKNGSGFYFGIAGGMTQTKIKSDGIETYKGNPNAANKYIAKKPGSSGIINLSGGYLWDNQSSWFPYVSLGLDYTYAFPSTVNGNIQLLSTPKLENYSYQYKLNRQTFLLMGKVDLYNFHNFMPFLLGGIGVSMNSVTGYNETQISNGLSHFDPKYTNATTTHLAYAIGAGLDYKISDNLWLSGTYRYDFLGYAETGKGTGIYDHSSLKQKLQANEFLLGVNYVFGG
jgi:opacity protein-like surface antigen